MSNLVYVVNLCGPTDCFSHAAFIDYHDAKEWGEMKSRDHEGYTIDEVKMEDLSRFWKED